MAAKGFLQRIRGFLSPSAGAHRAGGETEEDVSTTTHQARTRATGGTRQPEASDQSSTTGSTENETFVGRVAGEDVGYAGQTGAEAREQYTREEEDGQASNEDTTGNR